MMSVMAKVLNFTLVVFSPEDGDWGRTTDNGTWNGNMAEVINDRADLAIGCLNMEYRDSPVTY